jgi:transposase InsO family protein
MIVVQGEVYLEESHIEALRGEDEHVKKRYQAIAKTLSPEPFGITRTTGAEMINRCLRQFQRIVRRFRENGIPGIRFRSRKPKNSPNKTPKDLEEKVLTVRSATGFGPKDVSAIVKEGELGAGRTVKLYPSLTYNILVRNREIEKESRLQKECRRFQWGHPNQLIQGDLTDCNGVPILTMEDDHSRKGWAMVLQDRKDDTVIEGMKNLIRFKYENLLTDNGSQFSRKNAAIRKYCEDFLTGKHIWTSIHHPQTMGKLSAFQKGLKRFLRHCLIRSRDRKKMDYWIKVYVDWYNNGRFHGGIGAVPEQLYSGRVDEGWFSRLVKAFKLQGVFSPTS